MTDQPRRLLIVDDNITNLQVAIASLRTHGFQVSIARRGETGVERARYAKPDLILLDVQMPDIDGFETCRRLKADPETAQIPIIFMTVLSDPVDKVKGFELGAVDYLTKPIDLAETIARIQTHLALRDLQMHLEARVHERTAALQAEMSRRAQQEQERARLQEVISQQRDQLRDLTNQLLESQQQVRQGITLGLDQEIQSKLTLVQAEHQALQESLAHGHTQRATTHLSSARQIINDIQQVTSRLTADMQQGTAQEEAIRDSHLLKLTAREQEVFVLLAQGKSGTEIADILTISPSSVYTYTKRIRQKLDINDTAALVRLALKYNLLD